MSHAELLVVGAGPYALATAAFARESGIDTVVLGRPMGFWREHMPAEMYLRSGPDWHLDATGVHTLEAYLEHRGIAQADVDPLPMSLSLDHADWFAETKQIDVREQLVRALGTAEEGGFVATLDDRERLSARAVVCAPGVRHYLCLPEWAATLRPGQSSHSCDLVAFDGLGGARVLIVGGRQSAYEWAALMHERGAERIDIMHRHEVPRFDRVSWSFIDPHVEVSLSGDERLNVDHVLFATGYRANLSNVPYLASLRARIETVDGQPTLDEAFGTSIPGLYLTGFSATRDFGPFFGFVKGCPAAATLIVRDLVARQNRAPL